MRDCSVATVSWIAPRSVRWRFIARAPSAVITPPLWTAHIDVLCRFRACCAVSVRARSRATRAPRVACSVLPYNDPKIPASVGEENTPLIRCSTHFVRQGRPRGLWRIRVCCQRKYIRIGLGETGMLDSINTRISCLHKIPPVRIFNRALSRRNRRIESGSIGHRLPMGLKSSCGRTFCSRRYSAWRLTSDRGMSNRIRS